MASCDATNASLFPSLEFPENPTSEDIHDKLSMASELIDDMRRFMIIIERSTARFENLGFMGGILLFTERITDIMDLVYPFVIEIGSPYLTIRYDAVCVFYRLSVARFRRLGRPHRTLLSVFSSNSGNSTYCLLAEIEFLLGSMEQFIGKHDRRFIPLVKIGFVGGVLCFMQVISDKLLGVYPLVEKDFDKYLERYNGACKRYRLNVDRIRRFVSPQQSEE